MMMGKGSVTIEKDGRVARKVSRAIDTYPSHTSTYLFSSANL